ALQTFYHTTVLVTGFDIIFFWVARMIMMGLKFMDKVPFHEVYIHGLVRDSHGQKMSKSKGNVLDPIDLIDGIELEALVKKRTSNLMRPQDAPKIEKQTREDFPDGIPAFGTDALRFTFAAMATTGRDINFDMGRIGGYRNFCNKLWNAARYVLMNTEDKDCGQTGGEMELSASDRWILSRLQQVTDGVHASIKSYRFDHVAQNIYTFIWEDYCSWYLELTKVVLNDEAASEEKQRATRHTLVTVLDNILRLLHPIMPFITEEIWQKVKSLVGNDGVTIMNQSYPAMHERAIDKTAIDEMQWAMEVIDGLRNIRGELNIKPGQRISILIQGASASEQKRFESFKPYIQFLGRVDDTTFIGANDAAPESATALVGSVKMLVPLAGLIDKDAEMARLAKDIEKMEKNLAAGKAKLANKSFVAKAPAEVVEQETKRVKQQETALSNLREQIEKIARL
ncbi:MAG: class I tRNA ligase family protein, partial [Acidiferrobacterales bacterium]